MFLENPNIEKYAKSILQFILDKDKNKTTV